MNAMLQKIFLILTGACLLLAASAGWVLAQTYPAGTVNFEPRVGLFGTTNKRVSSIWTYGAAAGYFVTDNVALEVEGLGVYVNQTRPVPTYYGIDEVDRTAQRFRQQLQHPLASDDLGPGFHVRRRRRWRHVGRYQGSV